MKYYFQFSTILLSKYFHLVTSSIILALSCFHGGELYGENPREKQINLPIIFIYPTRINPENPVNDEIQKGMVTRIINSINQQFPHQFTVMDWEAAERQFHTVEH